jgi:IMP cyclohydrolase
MDIYAIGSIAEKLNTNTYPGRGIILGITPDGTKAVAAYFIMGRSVNSRNRVFTEEPDGISTEAFDPSLLKDPSLIIYHPVRERQEGLIVTNGDQTDTIADGFAEGRCFEDSLRTREFEPDGPNWTPRISGLQLKDGSYKMSILKSADAEGTACVRHFFDYPPMPGVGHFIHTYVCDGNPIPTFQGEPERVDIVDDIDEYTGILWNNLNKDNRVSLFVRYTDLESGEYEQLIVNENV